VGFPLANQLTLDLGASEPQVLHAHIHKHGYFTVNYYRRSRFCQEAYPIGRMPWVLDRLDYSRDLFISQHTFAAPNRRTPNVLSLNLAFLDFDYYRHPDPLIRAMTPTQFLQNCVIVRCFERGIPPPSFAMASGGGLYAKWLWDDVLGRGGVARWCAVERHLLNAFADLQADPKATLVSQIFRVPGSTNIKRDHKPVEIVWMSVDDETGELTRYDFDDFCESVLPYTPDDVARFRANDAARKAEEALFRARYRGKHADYEENGRRRDADRAAARSVAEVLELKPSVARAIHQDLASELWWQRLEMMRSLRAAKWPGGVPEHHRNQWLWVAANAMSWVSLGGEIRFDVAALAREFTPTLTPHEAANSVSGVVKLMREQGSAYKMHTPKFFEKLGITQQEAAEHFGAPRHQVNAGAMAFPKMRDLTYDEYKAETRYRQSAAAQRTNELKRAARHELRARVLALREEGLQLGDIAAQVGVPRSTVGYWCKG
jgi:hypothetical protein